VLEQYDMTFLLTQAALVLLAGIYAIRATSWIFGADAFEPLFLLATAVLGLIVFLFYRMPRERGAALFVVMALCVAGLSVNALLLFAPSDAHDNPSNAVFSALCMAGWAIVAMTCALTAIRSPAK
jgi:FtsH-binding integral membrane protein